jgi:hypothetical protein
MQLKNAKILASRGVGGTAEKILEVRDVTNVVLPDLLLEMTNRHVFDHALADGLVGHGDTPVSHEVGSPMILRQYQPSRYAALQCASRKLSPGNLPRERFSSETRSRHSLLPLQVCDKKATVLVNHPASIDLLGN